MTMHVPERSYWLMRLSRVADEAAPEFGHGIYAALMATRRQRWRRELRAGRLSEECRHWIVMHDRRGVPVRAAESIGRREGVRGWKRLRAKERQMQVDMGHSSFDERRCEACKRAMRALPLLLLIAGALALELVGIALRPTELLEPVQWLALLAMLLLAVPPLQRVITGYRARCEARFVEETVRRAREAARLQAAGFDAQVELPKVPMGDDWSSVAASWRALEV